MFITRLCVMLIKNVNMEIEAKYKDSLKLMNDKVKLSHVNLEILLEKCCRALSGKKTEDISSPPLFDETLEIKDLFASLLYIYAQFVRNSQSKEEFSNFLKSDCNIEEDQAKILEDYYEKWSKDIRIQLLNIGTHLPHITDVRWKIDYVIKSKALDQSDGPIFRVSLKTEKYDEKIQKAKTEFIEFTCTSQELQDLVYKLKDAVRHCQKLATEH